MDGITRAGGRHCSVCSGDREAIETAMLDGETLSSIAARFQISRTSLRRHRTNHMLMDAEALGTMGLSPVAIAARVQDIAERARMLADDAVDAGDPRAAIRAGDAELRALAGLSVLGVTHEGAAEEPAQFRIVTHAVMRAARSNPVVGIAIADQLDAVDQTAIAADLRGLFQENENRKAVTA